MRIAGIAKATVAQATYITVYEIYKEEALRNKRESMRFVLQPSLEKYSELELKFACPTVEPSAILHSSNSETALPEKSPALDRANARSAIT